MDPQNVGLLVNNGNALMSRERTDEALLLYDQVLAIYPEPDGALYNKGLDLSLLTLGRYNDSVAFFDKS
jgi:tetratricopeptide (TPR) repeat protein